MIYMRPYFPINATAKLRYFARWSKLRHEQLQEAISVSMDTVTDYLRRQLEKGHWREVQEVLHGKPMTKAGKFMLQEIKGNLVSKLILRLGLRKVVAVALVVVLLPLLVAKAASELAHFFRKQQPEA